MSVLKSSSLYGLINKSFKKRLLRFSGRNFLGRICVFHQGGGLLRLYRPLDFHRRINLFGRVVRLLSDSFRSSLVALVIYTNGLLSFIPATGGLALGSVVFSGAHFPFHSSRFFAEGSAIPIRFVNLFSNVCVVEQAPSAGASLFRAAGSFCILVSLDDKYAVLKSSSGWLLKTSFDSMATIGRCSNMGHRHQRIPNAGFNRRRGIRPTVRGVVKNPCDHPHGGGEGKGSPPAAQLTPWSKLTKGTPTTKKKWAIIRRRSFKNKK